MIHSKQSKSNPRTPINQNKYKQNIQSNNQHSSGSYKHNFSSNEVKSLNRESFQQQEEQYQVDCYTYQKDVSQQDQKYMNKIQTTNGNIQEEIIKARQLQINLNEIPQSGCEIQYEYRQEQSQLSYPKRTLQKNCSQISLSNGNRQSLMRSQRVSQENLFASKHQSIFSAQNSHINSISNLQNFHDNPKNDSNIFVNSDKQNELNKQFNTTVGQNNEQTSQSSTLNSGFQFEDNFNYCKNQNEIDRNIKKNQTDNHIVNQNINHQIEQQDYSSFLKNKQYSQKSLLGVQKNNKENHSSKTPLRKGSLSNISKISLNATPSNQNSSQNDNLKKNTKTSSKSSLKIIQDSSSYNSFIQLQKQNQQQQPQQQQNNMHENQNKFGSFCSQNSVQQSKQSINSYYTNQQTNQSQQINPLNSTSLQSQNSICRPNGSLQNQFDQSNVSDLYEKQFYYNIGNSSSLVINSNQSGYQQPKEKDNSILSHDNQQKPLKIGLPLQHVTQFASTCNSSQSTSRGILQNNIVNKQKTYIDQNNITQNSNQIEQNKQIQNNSPQKQYISHQPLVTQDEDYSVPQELQNAQQMNKNISKLQNLTTVKASDIDLLKNTEYTNSSQKQIFRDNRESLSSHQSRSDIQKIQLNIIQNNIAVNSTPQNYMKQDNLTKQHPLSIDIKNQNSRGKENIQENTTTQPSQKSQFLNGIISPQGQNMIQFSNVNGSFINNNVQANQNNQNNVLSAHQKTQTQIKDMKFVQSNLNTLNSNPINHGNNHLNNVTQFTGINQVSVSENDTQRQFNRQSIDSCLDASTKNIPQPFISQEKQNQLTMQHKNKTTRRNCNCDGNSSQMDSCSKVLNWLGSQKEKFEINQNLLFSQEYSELDNKILCQIQKDVIRTYQDYEFFWNPQIQSTIQHILYKFTKLYPEVGYVQGLNLIVGQLIWHADEINAFYLLIKIAGILNLNNLLKPGFPDLQKHLKIIDVLMILNCPEVFQILNKYELHPSMFVSEWIIALFTDLIPLEYSSLLLEGVLKEGWIFIYRAVINLIKQLLQVLQNLEDQSEILYVLKSVRTRQKEYQINWQQILQKQSPHVSNEFIEQIQNHIRINQNP